MHRFTSMHNTYVHVQVLVYIVFVQGLFYCCFGMHYVANVLLNT